MTKKKTIWDNVYETLTPEQIASGEAKLKEAFDVIAALDRWWISQNIYKADRLQYMSLYAAYLIDTSEDPDFMRDVFFLAVQAASNKSTPPPDFDDPKSKAGDVMREAIRRNQ